MEIEYQKLAENIYSNDIEQLCKLIDNAIDASSQLNDSELSKYYLDYIIKKILRNNKNIEIIEKIAYLTKLIKDPRNLYDEIIACLEVKALLVPTLMLMLQLQNSYKFTFDIFFEKLVDSLSVDNVQSEGFLLFFLSCLDGNSVKEEYLGIYLKKMSQLSIEVRSEISLKILYCILVIMRIYPGSFQMVHDMPELNMHTFSFEPIKNVVERIYYEAAHPTERPKMVFLQNFTFPSLQGL